MNEIILSDTFVERLTQNQELIRNYPFIKDAGDNLRGISRRGCSCNWGPKVKTVLSQIRGTLCALPPDEIAKIKKILNVEDRVFALFRKTPSGDQKVTL